MQSSNLSFLIWYKAMFLMSVTKKGFSAKEIQRQLNLKRYEPVWQMTHKLRRAMGNRDARYTLEGMIEMDEGRTRRYLDAYSTTNTESIEKEVKKGDTVTLYCLFLNEHTYNNILYNTLFISEFTQ